MTELELHQYLLREYPQENARCEWKEFKNLKNSFCGDEKDDVISYVSAIANMEGGFLVVGVHDKTLEIVGTDTYNYDRQKAILRLTDRCANLSSEGLDIEEFITDDTKKKVWVIHIPKHQPKRPVYAHDKAWQRIEDSLVELTQEHLNAILEYIKDVLPSTKSMEQKRRLLRHILEEMKNENMILVNGRTWFENGYKS
jgi:ATP-dependent DNA helicase RecG